MIKRRMILTEDEVKTIVAMRAIMTNGRPTGIRTIARAVDVSEYAVARALNLPAPGKITGGTHNYERTPRAAQHHNGHTIKHVLAPHVIAERDAAYDQSRWNTGQLLLGDPPSGRSALDRRS